MPSPFVAKLAAAGARDPEALAAWIGRKKHGKAFAKLARSAVSGGSSQPETRSASRTEITSGRMDESRMGPAELAFRRRAQARRLQQQARRRR